MRCSATVPSARHHEKIHPIAEITSSCSTADLLQVLDGPRRGVERVCPALIHEQFATAVFESAEVRVDSVDESSDAGVEIGNVRSPVEARGVVGEIVVNGVLEDWYAERRGEIALLQCPFDLGARGETWVELGVGFGVYGPGVDGFRCGKLGGGETG